jgi:hypothetical protein
MRRKSLLVAVVAALTIAVPMSSSALTPAQSRPIKNTVITFAVSCGTPTRCIAGGSTGTTADGGTGFLVKILDGVPGAEVPVARTAEISSLSCPTATFCEAVAYALTSADTATSGLIAIHNGKPGKFVRSPATADFISVSCVSAQTCEAVGYGTTNGVNPWHAVVRSITNGKPGPLRSVKHTTGLGVMLDAISCLAGSDCVAVGQGDFGKTNVFKSFVVRVTASGMPLPPKFGPGVDLNAVSCASKIYCYAVGWESKVQQPTRGIALPIIDGTPRPGSVHILEGSSMALDISCADATPCQAVGLRQPDPSKPGLAQGVVITVVGGGAGTANRVVNTGELYGVSCPLNGPCTSVGTTTLLPGQVGTVVSVLTHPLASTLTLRAAPKHAAKTAEISFTLTVRKLATRPRAVGTVVFTSGKTVLCSAAALRRAAPNEAAVCTVRGSKLGVGAHTIRASYDGDTNYQPAVATMTYTVT